MIFPTTHWSLLARATLDGKTESRAALNELCRRYWLPLNQFIRLRGHGPAEAQDLTQAFLLHLLEHSALQKPDRLKGRFRSFLLGALVRFLGDERDRVQAQKRGGGITHISLDEESEKEASPAASPREELYFDRAWAVATLRVSLARLGEEYGRAGQEQTFAAVRRFLPGSSEPPSYGEAAASLGTSVSAFTSELHRFRRRIRELVREEVVGTVSTPDEIEDEIAHLQRVLMEPGTDLRALAES
jgi:RNA polymerase sigma-70 factor (ECF subfamily)